MNLQQISDYGTSNPIVARLSLQTIELLKFYKISQQQNDALFNVFFSNVQPKLMACYKIKEKLTEEVRGHQKTIEEHGIPTQANGRVHTLPSILDLDHQVETFLYNAKSVLRDLTEVFSILFNKDFKKEARYDKVLKWATDKFEQNDSFVLMLKHDEDNWIKRIVKMRNAVEHPGGRSGVLHIENFTASKQPDIICVTEPLWHLNDDDGVPIVHEMDVMVSDMLTFCEETLILCLEKFPTGFPFTVVEIPEEKRDVMSPIRFKITMKMETLASHSLRKELYNG